ncbi:MAG: sel1 repeat family protein [Acidobacteriales bacterium]|nr:sel1 repeat family protein [Candidatus Koribacter versatilis]MBI3644524.1 sel1 repeat family protein [Terriglobales bacterium]
MRHARQIKSRAVETWISADKEWERGRVGLAFRLMLAAAKMGESGAQVNVGKMYDDAIGTKRNKEAALYWYRRAYRRGESTAAHNIGTVWRDDGNFRRALYWFERAIQMNGGDDGEASLEIAKLYLGEDQDPGKAAFFLRGVCKSKNVTQAAVEEARRLLQTTGR